MIAIDSSDWEKGKKEFSIALVSQLAIAMMESFQLIGLKAVKDYMIRSHVIHRPSGYNIGTAGSPKLNIRSGRLARSLVNNFNFSGSSGGGTSDSIRDIKVSERQIVGTFGSTVPYAAIHEYGGVISAKGGGFLYFKIGPFWYRRKSVRIPARPYLNPAADSSRTEITALHNLAVAKAISIGGV